MARARARENNNQTQKRAPPARRFPSVLVCDKSRRGAALKRKTQFGERRERKKKKSLTSVGTTLFSFLVASQSPPFKPPKALQTRTHTPHQPSC